MNEQNNVTRKEWHEVFLQAILFFAVSKFS